MADIFDYLKWRGDVPFSADPFNEVDNLILSELAYAAFDGIVEDSFRKLSLKTVCKRYFATHSREEAEKDDNHAVRCPLLMDGMLSGARFRNTGIIKYVNLISADKDMQMSAVTFLLDDGSAYVAFRGTDSTVIGWKEDFNMSYMPETAGQLNAVRYLNETGSKIKRPLRVGGHSKGGNFAVYASAFCNKEVQALVSEIYTNDGPGFRDEVMSRGEYRDILPKVISIVPDTSIIGMLLTSKVEHRIVKSSGKGFTQHDGLTWQVERNRFERAEQSVLGSIISGSQRHWLSKIDDDSRELFVNTVFSVIEATGADTFGEMEENKLKAAEKMLKTFKDIPKEKQKEVLNIMGELIQSSTEIAKKHIL